jgi:hypothetical protein
MVFELYKKESIMGDYYKLDLGIKLKPKDEIPDEIHGLLMVLFYQMDGVELEDVPKEERPPHPFWHTDRFYRIGKDFNVYDDEPNNPEGSPSYNHPYLKIRCEIKNGYDEIYSFLDWITPYVESVPVPGEYEDTEYENKRITFETNLEGVGSFYFNWNEEYDMGMAGSCTETKKQPLSERWKPES